MWTAPEWIDFSGSYRESLIFIKNSPVFVYIFPYPFSTFLRINKKGSQKDMEQKKAGAYFFYDEDDVNDIDDDDL